MAKLSRIAALVCASLALPALSQTLEGIVVTQSGEPVSGARVEVESLGIVVSTDEQGMFRLEDLNQGINEIHISALGYSHEHQDFNITQNQVINETFTLSRSAIEVIDIVSSPIHLSTMESAMPVQVLGQEQLRREQAGTLGDTLEQLPGIHTNFHAKVASTPIIRGLSGPRVQITQNGLDVSDVSRVGPDHAVATESSTAQQIEVLRGPATLFYGSGAIGGVVNVVDQRVPSSNETRGEWQLETSTVDDGKEASFNITTGFDNFAFYADGFYRDADDYEVPVPAELDEQDENYDHGDEHEHEHGDKFKVSNSGEESYGFTLGTSYLLSNGYVGVAVEQFAREYGIPGHTHGDEGHGGHDDHDEHDHGDEDQHDHSEEEVFADLEQTKVQILSELTFTDSILQRLNTRIGYTDYEHAEIEHGEVGTVFENETLELRADFIHQPIFGFNGGLSFHYKQSDVAAQGSEAFTPPSEMEMFALALMEERHIGDVLLQFGARAERVTLTAENLLLPEFDAHSHDEKMHEDEHDHDHDHDHGDGAEITRVFYADHEFTPITLSAGAVWNFHPEYNVGLSISRSQRAPAATELLSFGPHIGTRTFEIGALFALQEGEHEGEMEIGLTDKVIDLETSNNIDLTFRKTKGDINFVFNAFYNQIDNYYYQIDTGLFGDDGHDHGSDEHDHGGHDHDDHNHSGDEHDHGGELPVFIFQTDDVVLNGFEAQVGWQVNDTFKAAFFSDFVRARLQDGGDLPRTPPLRFGTQLSYENSDISAHLDITRYQSQDRIADFETTTDGYTLVDLHATYTLPYFNESMAVYLRGQNLTDQEARVHSSFLKDIAPRPGRNITLGIKGYF